jgi:hypothetical protein
MCSFMKPMTRSRQCFCRSEMEKSMMLLSLNPALGPARPAKKSFGGRR